MVFLPVCINASILDVCCWYDIASAVSMYISMVFGVVLAEVRMWDIVLMIQYYCDENFSVEGALAVSVER